jgi:hypothetical protein
MAALQGYFLRNKDDAVKAIDNIHAILETAADRHNPIYHNHTLAKTGPSKPAKNVKARAVKPLTVEQVDKMYFNPQPGWDKHI